MTHAKVSIMLRRILVFSVFILLCSQVQAAYMLIPMDEEQRNHLKAYGMTYFILESGLEAWWLLNYRGGSFAFPHNRAFERECLTRDISFEIIPDAKFNSIIEDISNPEVNMDAMKLEKAPKIAVYTPDVNFRTGSKIQPWDDAVTLVLTYAEIPYDVIYDTDVLNNKLVEYDWLHLHHEDFTGQYGRFYRGYHNQPWYREMVRYQESLAAENVFAKVSQLKLAVVKQIREYVFGGGFMFAMCSATASYDIALAAQGLDICAPMYDGDPVDPTAQQKLDFSQTFAFENFSLTRDPLEYEFSSIDSGTKRNVNPKQDYFSLFDFSAKWDPVPTMLTQNHTRTVKGFMGQSTAFYNRNLKSDVLILGENKPSGENRYINYYFGIGFWTFYGGHDPEDYRHYVNDPETDLNLHPNSPGYRLILNNVLFPAARKKERKT